MKIALAGLIYDWSVGDRLLIDCAEYLCKQNIKKYASDNAIEFVYIDYHGRNSIPTQDNNTTMKKKPLKHKIEDVLLSIITGIGGNPVKNLMYKRQYKKFFNSIGTTVYMKKYFEERLSGVDLLIICGGGTITYDVRVDFSKYYRRITNAAKEKNIPIVVLSAGIESRYNAKDERCRFFSETLSDDIYKMITTRDDIDELNKYVKNPNIITKKIADIGVWSADVFNIKKDPNSKIIGIGIIVAKRFVEFKTGITPEEYDRVLVDVIKRLEARGEQIVIFNNGNFEDKAYAEYISDLAGKKKTDVITAQSPEDIVRIISKFKGIITSRLHSCIPAYSLDIPFVALSWNKKLKYFADSINVPERAIENDRFNSETIIEEFDMALKSGYDNKFREEYKKTDLFFFDVCNDILKRRNI